jgi:hypothetical protein
MKTFRQTCPFPLFWPFLSTNPQRYPPPRVSTRQYPGSWSWSDRYYHCTVLWN